MVPTIAPAPQVRRKRSMTWLWIVLGVVAALVVLIVVLGLTQPRGHVASAHATFARPPAEVFAAISGHAEQTQWRKDLKSITLLPAKDGKTVFREVTGFGPVTYVVDESRPPNRYVVRILDESLPYSGSWTFDLEPAATGTRLTITESGEVKSFLFRALGVFFSKTATLERYLKALRAKFGDATPPS
jgi:uncharacterized protein YndB with AHSA1/START domain